MPISYEYEVIKLGSNVIKNTDKLNKKSSEGWELVSTVPIKRLHQTSGQVVSDIQAYLRKPVKKKPVKKKPAVING